MASHPTIATCVVLFARERDSHWSAVLIVHSLGSGSSGNAFIVHAPGGETIAIDCGIPVRKMIALMHQVGVDIHHLAGMFISHEHVDHVRSVRSFRRRGVAMFMTSGTARALRIEGVVGNISSWQSVNLGGYLITAIPVGHDAAEPCGFVIERDRYRIAIVTDLGTGSMELVDALCRCDLIVLESNHDVRMLQSGPYPAQLKRRVASNAGHLSNDASGAFLASVCRRGGSPSAIWLAHLSEENNRPDIAIETVQRHLARAGFNVPITALPRHGPVVSWDAAETSRPHQMSFDLAVTVESAFTPECDF